LTSRARLERVISPRLGHPCSALLRAYCEGTWFAPLPRMHTSNQRSGVSQVSPSDAQLRGRIQEQMHGHGEVDATKIGVVVRGGQVLLWGSVANEHERTLAGRIASCLTARSSVINHIQVIGPSES